jgi:hypothetical protein
LLSLPACTSSGQLAYHQGDHASDAPALGKVTLASQKAGNVTFAPTACSAGDNQQFLGGDFADDGAGMILRLVIDPLYGPAVRAFSMKEPNERSVVFRRSECRTFKLHIERTGLTVNDVDEYRIALDVDCANGDGDTLKGSVSSDSCL